MLLGLTLGLFSLTSMADEGNGPTASVEFIDNDGEVVGEGTIKQGPVGVLINFSIDGLDEGGRPFISTASVPAKITMKGSTPLAAT